MPGQVRAGPPASGLTVSDFAVAVDPVAAARLWIGTPFVHRASLRGAGADCLGLIRGIWREIHGAEPEALPLYPPPGASPDGAAGLWPALCRHLVAADRDMPRVGEVLLFRRGPGQAPGHLGLQSRIGADPAFIHAHSRRGVVECPLSRPWADRIVARFKLGPRG